VVLVAAEMNPLLPRDEAEALWRNLAARNCAARHSASKRSWLGLFAAVGARDATRMSETATALLAPQGVSETQRIYLYNALITGQLADRKFADARKTWAAMESALPRSLLLQPWMQLQRKWAQEPF
jgi:hypothetical protein